MATRTLKLYIGSQWQSEKLANVANERTGRLGFTVPQAVQWNLNRILLPVVKLYDSASDQISPATLIYVGKQVPARLPKYIVMFEYGSYHDLTTVEQRNVQNRPTLAQDLGQPLMFMEGEEIFFEFNGPDVIDWSKVNSFEFDVQELQAGV